ncbi:LLM class flavin-dependent oxidoreductase [Candidatus Poriferisodalis sp.]|uniref:LLM class flavin-dependent oxidoreductase n=1 Tax=Candidatus Poriferisodalis sp. TaxID=3101277 RepID=UPI003B02B8E0
MELAIQTPPENTDYARLRDTWQAADELGLAAAFTFDHFVPLSLGIAPRTAGQVPDGPQFEGWTMAAALATSTRRLSVGTLVSGITYRNPVLLAKMAVTLDHITGGRSVLGIGAAWHEAEHAMYGFDFPSAGERVRMLEETLEAIALLYDSNHPVDYRGRHVRLTNACFDPKPLQPGGIPILIGGKGRRVRRITAQHADWYNGFWAPWDWPRINDELDEELARAGRQPGELKRTVAVFSELSGDPAITEQMVTVLQGDSGETREQVQARIVAGSPDQMIAVLESYAKAGVNMVILNIRPDQGADELARFCESVLPACHGLGE